MLRSDTAKTAKVAAHSLLNDPRVSHFHDPRPFLPVGRTFGRRLLSGDAPLAWDVYLFYDEKARWRRQPPPPDDWRHQLGSDDAAADPRFRVGEALATDLETLTKRLLEQRDDESE